MYVLIAIALFIMFAAPAFTCGGSVSDKNGVYTVKTGFSEDGCSFNKGDIVEVSFDHSEYQGSGAGDFLFYDISKIEGCSAEIGDGVFKYLKD